MQRRLVISYLVLVAFALIVFTVPVGISLASLLRSNQEDVGLREARTVAFLLGKIAPTLAQQRSDAATQGATATLESLRANLEQQTGGRVELIDDRGRPALGRAVRSPDAVALRAALRGEEKVSWPSHSILGSPALEVTVPARRQRHGRRSSPAHLSG